MRVGRTSAIVTVTALLMGLLAPMAVAYGTAESGTTTPAPAEVAPIEPPAAETSDVGDGAVDEALGGGRGSSGDGGTDAGAGADAGVVAEDVRPSDDAVTTRRALTGPLDAVAPTIEALSTTAPASAVPTEVPASHQAKIIVRAGADRRTDGWVAGLRGVTFELYRVTTATDLTGGTHVGTCTTGADGACGVVVDLPRHYNRYYDRYERYGYYYAKQVSAPAGWSPGATWGSDVDHVRYVRHNTGQVTGGSTVDLRDRRHRWPNVRDNPPLEAPSCGLDVGYVIDLSNSITRYETDEAFTEYKEQATALVDALAGTPTTMRLYTFATGAPAAGNAEETLGRPTSLLREAGWEAARQRIRGLVRTPSVQTGYANWDAGLAQTIDKGHDVVVLLTDGEPTASRRNADGDEVTLEKIEDAVHSANGVKAGGTRIVAVGVIGADTPANERNLELLSDHPAVRTTPDLAQLGPVLEDTAAPLVDAAFAGCAASLTVNARLEQPSGGTLPAVGWELTADGVAGSAEMPSEATTGADGTVSFTVSRFTAGLQRITVTQAQREGYAMSRAAGDSNATCTADGRPVAVVDTDGGFAVDVPMTAPVECTMTNTPVASGYDPASTEAKVVVRAGGDRLRDGSVAGLPGATFDIYRAPSATALDGGTRVGTCTTGDDGTCAVVIGLGDAAAGAAFYGVQTAAPTGWTVARTWGDEDELLRYSTGTMTGGQTTFLPDGTRERGPDFTRHWPQVRDNPGLPPRCGLDVALVYDLSNSVARPTWPNFTYFDEYKEAGIGMVDALEGTPSRLALYTYATNAPADGETNGTLELTPVARPAGADAVRDAIRGLTATPDDDEGFTNWDVAMAQLPSDLDVVLFLTDGEPTDSRSTRWEDVGYSAALLAVEEAMHSANAVKAGGAHLVAIGAGPAQTPANQQRLRMLSENARMSDFDGLGELLRSVALDDCVGTVSITKDVSDPPGAEPAPGGPGWGFVVQDAASEELLARATTGAEGTAGFTFDLSDHAPNPRPVTVIEVPREGYAIEPQGERNAVCKASDDAPVTVVDVANGFIVEARHDAAISCTVVNAALPRPDVTIAKTSTIDTADGSLPTVFSDTAVTWHYTVTNTGNVPLTNLRVTDDRGVDVTCPPHAQGPARHTIAALAPGERLTCSATGPVAPTAAARGTANERT